MVPTDQMLLRWTSVIKAKRDGYLKCLEQEAVDPKLPFVIAVNTCRLGGDTLGIGGVPLAARSEEHTSELQSRPHLVCRLLLEKKKGTLMLYAPEDAACKSKA